MLPRRQQLIEEFMESARTLGRALWAGKAEHFQRLKLHPAQVRVLYFIRHGSVSVKQIAEAMCASPSAATQLVNFLVKAGYLKRVPDPTDRRRVAVHISEQGRKKFERMRQYHLNRMAKFVSVLSDAELKTLISIQSKIADAAKR